MKKNVFLFVSALLLSASLHAATDNAILSKLYQADQKDRNSSEIDWERLIQNDRKRIASVKKMLAGAQVRTSRDYANAAAILNHGSGLSDFRLGNAIATLGLALHPQNRDLMRVYATTWDRMMLAQNRTQWYATQFSQTGGAGLWKLDAVDEKVSEFERKELALPSLAEMQNKISEMNSTIQVSAASPVSAPASKAEVFLTKDVKTMQTLAERHQALGLFWLRLAEFGLPKPLMSDLEVSMQTGFRALDKKDALAVINGDKPNFTHGSSGDACFVEYKASVDGSRNLILDLGIDCKVKPAPTLTIRPEYFYRMIIGGLGPDLKGKDLRLISIAEALKQ